MSSLAGKRCLILTAITDLSTQAAAEANLNTDIRMPRRLVKGGGLRRK